MSNRTDHPSPPVRTTPEPLRHSFRTDGKMRGLEYEAGLDVRELDSGGDPGGDGRSDERKAIEQAADDESSRRAVRAWESEGGATAP